MLAPGHLAISYFITKIISYSTKTKPDLKIIWILALLPDIDLLIPGIPHRGQTHSVLLQLALFLPIIIYYGRSTLPYLFALLSHSLIGDIVSYSKIMLFWPLDSGWYSVTIPWRYNAYVYYLEAAIFIPFVFFFIQQKDYQRLYNDKSHNLLTLIPATAIIIPIFYNARLITPRSLLTINILALGLLLLSYMDYVRNSKPVNTRKQVPPEGEVEKPGLNATR
jgi:membrane-bound metal-dependent hydrolase YbcI (DUF457 family)